MNNTTKRPLPPCPDCGTSRAWLPCPDCRGYGGWWNRLPEHPARPDGEEWAWQPCYSCAGDEWIAHCPNFNCPGKVSYPAHVPGFKDLFS